ncbi:hypothetical protein GXW82_11755 [Streptacidiphilus sp. 4-A2]|nr:hypothetical protein [Streptacidiphilus sp. 4-A2]
MLGAMLVLAGEYVSDDEHNADQELQYELPAAYDQCFGTLRDHLTARYGEPVASDVELRWGGNGDRAVWQLPDVRLVLESYINVGGVGDFECQLWLAAVRETKS